MVRDPEELSLYVGADVVGSYRAAQGLTDHEFLYAYVVPDRGQEAIYATYIKANAGTGISTVNIWANRRGGTWVCRHAMQTSPAGTAQRPPP